MVLPPEIAEALARGMTILTGNQRAARTLRLEADLAQRAAGLSTWKPPAIFAWDAWTAQLWRDLLLGGHTALLLLNAAQEHILWRDAIVADAPQTSLLAPDALADLAADAWSRLCAYRGAFGGTNRLRANNASLDTRAFVRWATAFEGRCRDEGLLSRAAVEAALMQAGSRRQLQLNPAGYLLVGFDRTTPAQEALLTGMRAGGTTIDEARPAAPSSPLPLVEAATPKEELETTARALRQHLERNPSARVALIVPGLASRRAEIDRVLRNTLAPELNDLTATSAPPPYEFSLGVPLGGTPAVMVALDLLHWAIGPLPLDRIGTLLLSPFVAGGTELAARADCDAYTLRRASLLRPELSLEKLTRTLAGCPQAERIPQLLVTLRAMLRAVNQQGLASLDARSHADWSDAMRAFLQAAHWETPGDSVTFQTYRKWDHLLDDLATLDFTGVRVSFREALAAVDRLARETLFAPESRNAPVQVMGPLEAAGSTFDMVWVMGAGDRTWSTGANTSPLLSWQFQRELGMPGTQPAEDLEHARLVAGRLAGTAVTVFFSYAQQVEQTQQRASTALAGLALTSATVAELALSRQDREPVRLEAWDDSTMLPPLPDRIVRGGATILKHQAACGFRAFAEHRLWATSLAKVEFGMDARERGSDVHEVLELFWKRVASQAQLKSLTPAERTAILAEAVDHTLSHGLSKPEGWDAAFIEVQRERLLTLLDAWLMKEMERDIPFSVKLSETEMTGVAIGPLRLTLRVDRVDETEFGDVILDYKTGAAHPNSWLTNRPDEPQLPLYAVLAASAPEAAPLAGVGFAEVRAGRGMALRGFQTQTGILLKSNASKDFVLDHQLKDWHAALTTLAEDFYRGDVRVRPKAYPQTCKFCEQRLLCRLDVTVLAASSDEPDEEEDDARG